MIPVSFPSELAHRELFASARAVSIAVVMKSEIEPDARCERCQPEQQRTDSKASAGGLDRRDRDLLGRDILRNRRRRIDLWKNAAVARRLSCGSRGRGSAHG
jgi:hypothetical protein